MKINKTLADGIQLLRFPLIVGIVATHCFSTSSLYVGDGNIYSLCRCYCQILFSSCVPSFFFISGYLFFAVDNFSFIEYSSKIKRRISSLLQPYILWIIIAYIYFYFKFGLPFSFSIFWSYNSWNAPLVEPLWYVRNLMIFVVFSPLIYILIKYTKGCFVLFLSICYILGCHFGVGIMYFGSLLFFSLGSLFSILKIDLYGKLKQTGKYIIILAMACSFLCLFSEISLRIYCCISIFAVIYSSFYFVESEKFKPNTFLTRSTFFIYALHGFAVTGFYMRTMSILIPDQLSSLCLITRYFLTILLTVLTCLLLFYILTKVCPRVVSLLIGARR